MDSFQHRDLAAAAGRQRRKEPAAAERQAGTLLEWGNRHAQASEPALDLLFLYSRLAGIENIDPTHITAEGVRLAIAAKVRAFVTTGKLHQSFTAEHVMAKIDEQIDRLLLALQLPIQRAPDTRKLVQKILPWVIDADYHYLVELRNGRPRDPHLSPQELATNGIQDYQRTVQQDPLVSHLCFYGLQEQSAGTPTYDQLYRELSQEAQRVLQDTEPEPGSYVSTFNVEELFLPHEEIPVHTDTTRETLRRKLERVIDVYKETHAGIELLAPATPQYRKILGMDR